MTQLDDLQRTNTQMCYWRIPRACWTRCSVSQSKCVFSFLENNHHCYLNHNENSKLENGNFLYSAENKHRPSRRPAWLLSGTSESFLNRWLNCLLAVFCKDWERPWLHVHHKDKQENKPLWLVSQRYIFM